MQSKIVLFLAAKFSARDCWARAPRGGRPGLWCKSGDLRSCWRRASGCEGPGSSGLRDLTWQAPPAPLLL